MHKSELLVDVKATLKVCKVVLYHLLPHCSSDEGTDDEGDQTLPREKLLLLTACLPVVEYLNTCDHILYQCIVDFLVPNVLRPIPGTLTQAIRNFAKSLEGWLAGSLEGYGSTLTKSKVRSYSVVILGCEELKPTLVPQLYYRTQG